MNFLLAFIAFNVIVIVHELGHFLAAKKFGIKVLEFSLFVGPKLFSIQRGETMYSLRLFPIMAYVKMEGEEEASDSDRAYNKAPKHARAITSFGGPFANLLLAAVLLTIMFTFTEHPTMKISKVDAGSPAAAAKIQEGDIVVSYGGAKVYQPQEYAQFLYISKGAPATVGLIRDGELMEVNLVPTKEPPKTRYLLGVSLNSKTDQDSNVILSITSGYPAEEAGLKINDRIIRLDDTEIPDYNAMREFLSESKDREVKVTVLRDGQEQTFNLKPRAEKLPEQYLTGMYFSFEKGGVLDALKYSVTYTYTIIRSVVFSLEWLITGKIAINQMMGPIGMVGTIGDVVQQGQNLLDKVFRLLEMTALMSVAVGATNLIPFPALDGSKLLLIGVEAVRRKPLPVEKEAFITMVGFAVLILFAIYVAYNDIIRRITG